MEENKKNTMTYNDIFNRSFILRAIPLKGIAGKSLCDIIMMQVDYGKAVDAFNTRMDEGLKKLKEEKFPKFDEESQKEEKDRCPEYTSWLSELEDLYGKMRMEEAAKPAEIILPKMTAEILTAVCETGVEGNVTLPGGTDEKPNLVPKIEILRMLASMIEN